jgi:hypothetical protein
MSTEVTGIRRAMTIPTETIGRLPRPVELVDALAKKDRAEALRRP